MPARRLAHEALRELFLGGRREALERVQACVTQDVDRIVDAFYEAMTTHEEAAPFLDHETVETRLRHSMATWLRDLFRVDSEEALTEHLARQLEVGEVHARIRVPLYLVLHGMRVLRGEIARTIGRTSLGAEDVTESVLAVSDALDYLAIVINESFVKDALRDEREAQSLRDTMLGRDVAVECERARADLFDWERRTFEVIRRGGEPLAAADLSPLGAPFGGWLTSKADLLVGDEAAVDDLRRRAGAVGEALDAVRDLDPADVEGRERILADVHERVSQMGASLTDLADAVMTTEAGRDPLTRLLNRRYLPTVLQRETRTARVHGTRYALLVLDVDHFKRVNDEHGHDAGDAVLRELASVLLRCLRTSDFVFRYGGEEFLIVLGNADAADASGVAQSILDAVRREPLDVGRGAALRVTVSIGIAVHDGHPDYHRTLARADEALYQAKREGRDRWVRGETG